jgi:hypothetical protein
MQVLPVYLYQNNLDVTLDLDPTIRGVNQVMYQHDLKIQKGLKNKVRIQFKNSDQKRISISNTQTFVFSMYDAINRRVLLEKELTVLDQGTTSTRGIAELTLTESDTLDLDKTSYTYSVKYVDPTDGTYLPAYSNTYYGINGTLHLHEDIYPVLQPSQEVLNLQMSFNISTDLYEYKSRAIYASPEYNGNTALHTLAFYLTGFKGAVYVQGTLNNNANDQASYSTIKTLNYNGYTGVAYTNFTGVYSYLNILVVPARGPLDLNNRDNQDYRGTFDKFLYRS